LEAALSILYGDGVAGEVFTVEEFRLRLADIEAVEFDDSVRPDFPAAMRAFEGLVYGAPSRHHQLELLRQALGLGV